jgi:GNAT superfamily N-acetyltransferase
MINDLMIRNAKPGDIEALIGLLKLLFAIETDFSFDAAKQGRGLQLMFKAPDTRRITVAEINNRVIGMCSAQLLVSTAEGGMAALIEDMVVVPEYRGQGIGKKLLAAIEDWAFQQGVSRVELLADHTNAPALAFYQTMKWSRTRLICLHKKSV